MAHIPDVGGARAVLDKAYMDTAGPWRRPDIDAAGHRRGAPSGYEPEGAPLVRFSTPDGSAADRDQRRRRGDSRPAPEPAARRLPFLARRKPRYRTASLPRAPRRHPRAKHVSALRQSPGRRPSGAPLLAIGSGRLPHRIRIVRCRARRFLSEDRPPAQGVPGRNLDDHGVSPQHAVDGRARAEATTARARMNRRRPNTISPPTSGGRGGPVAGFIQQQFDRLDHPHP